MISSFAENMKIAVDIDSEESSLQLKWYCSVGNVDRALADEF